MAGPTRFWMVKGRGPANFRHDTLAEAETEAARLARVTPGECFYVMEAVCCHRRVDVERINLRGSEDVDLELPF